MDLGCEDSRPFSPGVKPHNDQEDGACSYVGSG